MSGNKLVTCRDGRQRRGVLDSGDAGFRRHIALTLSVGYGQAQCAFSAKG